MKTIKCGILGTAALFLASTIHLAAIEGLKISVECSDVILSWPSSDTNNEYFIVQYRSTLDVTNEWQTLASWLPAESGTNRTHFVHEGIVQGCTYASMMRSEQGGESMMFSEDKEEASSDSFLPLAMPAGGSSDPVPLIIYPPGFDLSGFVIFDPVSGKSVKGDGYIVGLSPGYSLNGGLPDFPGDGDGPEEGEELTDSPDTGFYRVVRNGVHLVGITNGMTLSGIQHFLVEAGSESGELHVVSVNEEGAPLGSVSVNEPPFALPLSVTIDTTQMSNGVHTIYASASWTVDGEPYLDADSPPITVNVYNEISFPNWMPHFGQLYDALLITARSAHQSCDWYIDVYGGNSGYIGTLGGHTDDGVIEVSWNLIGPPPNFVSYTNEPYFQFFIETFFDDEEDGPQPQAAGSAGSPSPTVWKNWDHWSAHGDWVVANQLAWDGWLNDETLNYITDGFVIGAEAYGRTVRPSHPYQEAFRIHFGVGAQETSDWQTFRDAVFHPNSRNLFYLGHGLPGGIGRDLGNTNSSIRVGEIRDRLHTVPPGQTNRHAFRFVFLDGCQTAKGKLAEAFGIVQKENLEIDYYANAGERPTAFVGWNTSPTVGSQVGHQIFDDHWKFIQNFSYRWGQGQGVREALTEAKNGPLNFSVDVNPKDITVFGFKDLGPNQYNTP